MIWIASLQVSMSMFHFDGAKLYPFIGGEVFSNAFPHVTEICFYASIFLAVLCDILTATEPIKQGQIATSVLYVGSQSVLASISSQQVSRNSPDLKGRQSIPEVLWHGCTIRFCWVHNYVSTKEN